MNNKKNYKKGTRHQIVKIILFCGFITKKSLSIINGSTSVYKRKAHEMLNEGVLKDTQIPIDRKVQHVLTLRDYPELKETLIKEIGQNECNIYESYGAPVAHKVRFNKQNGRRPALREILSVETQMFAMMSGAGTTLNGEPILFNLDTLDDKSRYYTSKEYKRYTNYYTEVINKDSLIKDKSSLLQVESQGKKKALSEVRIIGVLFSSGGNYAVYNFGNRLTKLSTLGEHKIANMISSTAREKNLLQDTKGLFVARDLSVFLKLFSDTGANKQVAKTILDLDAIYKHLFILPYTQEGRKHLRIMQQDDWEEKIKLISLRGLQTDTSLTPIACDGYKDNQYVLLFAIPDIAKLYRFIVTAKANADSSCEYTICCFDYQETFIRQVTENTNCRIKVAPFAKIEKYFDV